MDTQTQILDAGRDLIAVCGYNGFSYSDVSKRVGVRNASVHHYFPAKSDLALAVVRNSRVRLEHHASELAAAHVAPLKQIEAYVDYWAKCIVDGSAPFCVAGMLASELPTLPKVLADEVQAHFESLTGWFTQVFETGRGSGELAFSGSARAAAERFVATVYGAMLSARAMRDARLFSVIVDQALVSLRDAEAGSA